MRRSLACAFIIAVAATHASAQVQFEGKLDRFGNPVGKNYGLAADGQFKGKRLLAWRNSSGPEPIFALANPLWEALKAKGFVVSLESGAFRPEWLNDAEQLWIFSGNSSLMELDAAVAIERFVNSGRGLYLVADNEPFVLEADQLAQRLYGIHVTGDYPGGKTIAVRNRATTDADAAKSETGALQKRAETTSNVPELDRLPGRVGRFQNTPVTHYVDEHPLLKGINFIYEGVTISHLEPSDKLQTVLVASDRQILAAVSKVDRQRVVIDCGFTRYFPQFVQETAGTLQYAQNVAAYLMGVSVRPIKEQSVAELLASAGVAVDDPNRTPALEELAQRSPTYREVEAQLADITKAAQSRDAAVAAAARQQLVNAFLRAPISECLDWLGRADAGLSSLIWEQIDNRIQRADSERRGGYRDVALRVLMDKATPLGSRRAAIDLLEKLNDRSITPNIIAQLPQLPRELWQPCGDLLQRLTGQDFGPRATDGLAETMEATKKWRTWWRTTNGQ